MKLIHKVRKMIDDEPEREEDRIGRCIKTEGACAGNRATMYRTSDDELCEMVTMVFGGNMRVR